MSLIRRNTRSGVDAVEDDAGGTRDVRTGDDEVLELSMEDDEPMDQAVMDQYDMESDDGSEAGSSGPELAAPMPEEGPELESPNAKRSRSSRISESQSLCTLEKLKSRNDVREIIGQLEKSRKFASRLQTSKAK